MSGNSAYVLNLRGLTLGRHKYEFDVDDDFFSRIEESEIKKGRAKVGVDLLKQSGLLSLDFDIEGEVEVACDRCLEEFMLPVDYKGTLQVKYSDEEKEGDGDVIWINPNEGELDLAQYIYESIVLSLPCQRVHGSDGEGKSLCNPDMLKRFRILSDEEYEGMFSGEDEIKE